jgi:hypothetical protein
MPREDALAPGISLGLNLRFLICEIRKMSARRVGSWLILLGLTCAITSIVWWQNFYNQVMGHAPVACLYQLTGSCRMVSSVASFFGAAAYDPQLLWASGGVAIVGLLLQR